ncbi:SDR family oxidoreductase [Streptomyces sp. ISL-66]|uniref:SDR family oxidoreductase n=1 Tax=Streptomyces sp. ISL-66 TaxID=2819186 RepID=UPI001BEA7B58|nr:SDR family oxidoreductase [Streptomyces sp. ISL-66]MBT2468628.1 SDR family oxidoreductase [Streptomyces sp. ISL-66]
MSNPAYVDLRDKQALVTGAARGLGAAIARRLAAAGASVLVADVRQDLAKELCEDIMAQGGSARSITMDVCDPGAVADVFRDVDEAGQRVDILVNNAAVDVSKSAEHLTAEEVTRVVNTNLLGPMYLCLEGYRRMVSQGGGHIVNILSTAANRTWTEAGPYAASKSGLRAFTHTLFKEAQRDCEGIGVTGVIAGGMETAFILERFPDADVSMLQSPEIVADTVLYALSVPVGSALAELVVVPRREPSWP